MGKLGKAVLAMGTIVSVGSVIAGIIDLDIQRKKKIKAKEEGKRYHKPYGPYEKYIKRSLDFGLSILGLVIVSPVLLVVSVLVRIKLGLPVFFTQERTGLDEMPFKILKFRTMIDKRDENGELLPDEKRFSDFGNFLRSVSIDELPELINVVKGEMSLVGPRPLYTSYLPYYTVEEAKRHDVRGGITGLAQINGRVHCPMDKRMEYDLNYVEKITFLGDLKILFITFFKVLKRSDVGMPTVDDEKMLNELRGVQRQEYLSNESCSE